MLKVVTLVHEEDIVGFRVRHNEGYYDIRKETLDQLNITIDTEEIRRAVLTDYEGYLSTQSEIRRGKKVEDISNNPDLIKSIFKGNPPIKPIFKGHEDLKYKDGVALILESITDVSGKTTNRSYHYTFFLVFETAQSLEAFNELTKAPMQDRELMLKTYNNGIRSFFFRYDKQEYTKLLHLLKLKPGVTKDGILYKSDNFYTGESFEVQLIPPRFRTSEQGVFWDASIGPTNRGKNIGHYIQSLESSLEKETTLYYPKMYLKDIKNH